MRTPRRPLDPEERRLREEDTREAATPPRFKVGSIAWRLHVARLNAAVAGSEGSATHPEPQKADRIYDRDERDLDAAERHEQEQRALTEETMGLEADDDPSP